jgi:hypothetical protein
MSNKRYPSADDNGCIILIIGLIVLLAMSCATTRNDCGWKQQGYQGYGPAKTGKR